jgi:hypothetical protein
VLVLNQQFTYQIVMISFTTAGRQGISIGTFALVRLFANCFFMNENRRGEIAAILELPLVSLVGIPSA